MHLQEEFIYKHLLSVKIIGGDFYVIRGCCGQIMHNSAVCTDLLPLVICKARHRVQGKHAAPAGGRAWGLAAYITAIVIDKWPDSRPLMVFFIYSARCIT
jgi:hypothetical protein